MDFLDHAAARNQSQAQFKQLKDMADKFKKKEGNEDKKRCLEDMKETLTGAAVLVERLRDAKNGKHHRRKLNQGKADEDFVRYKEALWQKRNEELIKRVNDFSNDGFRGLLSCTLHQFWSLADCKESAAFANFCILTVCTCPLSFNSYCPR